MLSKAETLGAEDIILGRVDQAAGASDAGGIVLPPGGIKLRELENTLIQQALARANNNQTQAAKLLHLSRDAFRYRLEKLGLL